MNNDSQLFQIQKSLKKNKKKSRKNATVTHTGENKGPVVSMGFCDDLRPIQLSIGSVHNNSALEPVTEYSEQYAFDEMTLSMSATAEEYFNENENISSRSISLQDSEFETPSALTHEQNETGLAELTNSGEQNKLPTTLSDAEITDDLAMISQSPHAHEKNQYSAAKQADKDDFFKRVLEKNQEQSKEPASETEPASNRTADAKQSIFDAIAKSMNYANAFDLGDYVLEQRFDLFDEEENKNQWTIPKIEKNYLSENKADIYKQEEEIKTTELSTKDFVEDLDIIHENAKALMGAKRDKDWPAAPSNLNQPTAERTKQMFGEFEYESKPDSTNCEIKIKGSWESTNIEEVEMPQLKGKINGTSKEEITKGSMRFNKKAQKQLQKLWKAWEDAKLLDRIITFDGAFVARYKKVKGGGCGTSLSNHAWGTAFDINAEWNGLGAEPAFKGEKGSVRELVELANQHGFYWGGHLSSKDGMHFEVAKIIEYTD